MSTNVCVTCNKSKATLQCGLCACATCKYCAQILDEQAFSFLPQIPETLSHQVYCATCFHNEISDALNDYNDTMERAKEIRVFFKTQSKETRLIKRLEPPFLIENCADEEETVMRLAFLAVKAGFNSLIDVHLKSEKVRIDGYQTLKWTGTAVPANVQDKNLLKDRSIWSNPN